MTSLDSASMLSSTAGLLSPALRALGAFAERKDPTQADIDEVMRALVSHDDWVVPVPFARQAWGQVEFAQVLTFDEAAPTTFLTVFTDQDSALLADGQAIGGYGGPISGVQLMRSLDLSLAGLIVNPASPREHQWYISTSGFDATTGWATAIAAERALADRRNGPVPVRELLAHRYHLLVESTARTLTQVYLPEIDGAMAVCFTAVDRAEEFMRQLPQATRALAELAVFDGPEFFDMMRAAGAAGLVVNAGSDDQAALTREDLTEIAGRSGGPR